MRKLKVDARMDREKKRYAVEAALLIGFQTESAVFPAASLDGEIEVPDSEEKLLGLWTLGESESRPDYMPAQGKGPVFEIDFREKQGLENIFSRGLFLKDENADFLPDKLDVKIVIPEDPDLSIVIAACNFAFRFGMETTKLESGILAEEGYKGNAVIFEPSSCTEVSLEETEGAVRVHVRGRGRELEEFSSLLCEHFPLADGWRSWRDVLLGMTDDFILRGADGQLACLKALTEEKPDEYVLYGSPEITEKQKRRFPGAEIRNYKSGAIAYERVYEAPWEADVFHQILEEEVYPFLKKGDSVAVEGALSEEKAVRGRLADRMKMEIEALGAVLEKTELICAYKQGFSWIDEIVIPSVEGQNVEKVEIFFKPFLPKGQEEWLDEDGATPSYHNVQADNPDKWYDLPIRFLQELYPIEDVLVDRFGISEERISFNIYEGTEDITYLCRVAEKEGSIKEFKYRARYSERPYLDEYPQMGKVHPSTGYIKVKVNGEKRLERRIAADLETIWEIYQKNVLPECRAYIEKKTGGVIEEESQPFFEKLLLDVSVSEPDYRVGCREDLFSSLDAFHEDLYFAGGDYFKNYGLQKNNVLIDAPGLILPEIHHKEGAPVFRAVLYERTFEEPCVFCGPQKIVSCRDRDQVSLRITRIYKKEDRLGIEIETTGVSGQLLKSYSELFSEGVLENSRLISPCYEIRFRRESQEEYSACPPLRREAQKKKITEINLHENELIGYDTYREIIEELKCVEGVEVFRTARSYAGRELYAVWLKPRYEGYLSMTKRLTRCPSEIINARHHANEVSSTNAAFILLRKLLTEEKYQGAAERLNLVLVPMENVDGSAIHYELQKEHPYWKLHVARFNAVGKEFYREHFKQDTIHEEAMGLTRLYEKYAPDIIVDNHGVPSHEWEQQFSGYTSPSYKGFWLPRSLLYGYFWYVTDPEFQANYPVNKQIEDVIADKIAEDEEMTAWNKEWSRQFEKYAHAWMPKLFPADYYKQMINYWIPFQYDREHRYPSIRFPWITTVAYTSEVADETAQGSYLNLCARAHVAHDEAVIQMILEAEHVHTRRCVCQKGEIFAEYSRQRPMIVRGFGENKYISYLNLKEEM